MNPVSLAAARAAARAFAGLVEPQHRCSTEAGQALEAGRWALAGAGAQVVCLARMAGMELAAQAVCEAEARHLVERVARQ